MTLPQTQTTTPLLSIRNLVVTATGAGNGRALVNDVSLQIRRGEVLGLIGESGAGKSTIGLAALGFTREGCRIASGVIEFDSVDLARLDERSRSRYRGTRIAYVAQSAAAALNPRRTLIDQCIEVVLRDGKMSRNTAVASAVALFRRLRLPDPEQIGERYPHELSGGQLQRVMTGMAMLPKPDLVVFDEPTTALDVTTQVEVLLAIRALIREVGSAALYISHDLNVVMQIADRIMILRDGRRVEENETAKLVQAPETTYARALLNVESFRKTPNRRDASPQPLLRADGISMRYGDFRALHRTSIEVRRGETLAVVGESGSGKSTLAGVLTGLLRPIEGAMQWKGQPLALTLKGRNWEEIRRLQIVHQSPDTALNPRQTVRQVIERPLQWFGGYDRTECNRRARDLLLSVELDPDSLLDRRSTALSGGQKQRVCIARALAAEPELIICDEVTSALDPLVADGILRLLDRLQAEFGLSYLFITHDLATVRSVADRVVVMKAGEVVDSGTVDDLFTRSMVEYTRRLIRATPQKRPGWLDDHLATRDDDRRDPEASDIDSDSAIGA